MFCHLKRRLNVQNRENTSDLNSSDLSFMAASSCTFDLFQHCCCFKGRPGAVRSSADGVTLGGESLCFMHVLADLEVRVRLFTNVHILIIKMH